MILIEITSVDGCSYIHPLFQLATSHCVTPRHDDMVMAMATQVFDSLSLMVFAIEVALRMWATWDHTEYFSDMYCFIDLIVLVLDVIFMVGYHSHG